MDTKFIGWAAGSLILLAVLLQLKRQRDAATAKGVSPWLHIGTALGNVGFFAHGALAGDTVIALTSGALVLTSLTGVGLWALHDRREREIGAATNTKSRRDEATAETNDARRETALSEASAERAAIAIGPQ